jgi:hypothetical protein
LYDKHGKIIILKFNFLPQLLTPQSSPSGTWASSTFVDQQRNYITILKETIHQYQTAHPPVSIIRQIPALSTIMRENKVFSSLKIGLLPSFLGSPSSTHKVSVSSVYYSLVEVV